MSGVELSGVEMSTFGIKIGHFNPRLYNRIRIYCVIPGVEMSPTPSICAGKTFPYLLHLHEYQNKNHRLTAHAFDHCPALYNCTAVIVT